MIEKLDEMKPLVLNKPIDVNELTDHQMKDLHNLRNNSSGLNFIYREARCVLL